MASSVPPVKGVAFDLYFSIFDGTGNVIASPTGMAARTVNANDSSGATCDNSPTVVDATGGCCKLTLSATEMNSDYLWVKITSTSSGAQDTAVTLYTAAQNNDDLLAAVPTATENADALLNRDMSAVSDSNSRSPLNALRILRNKVDVDGATMTVTKENDTTEAWTATVTTSGTADPITAIDPD